MKDFEQESLFKMNFLSNCGYVIDLKLVLFGVCAHSGFFK